jgi:rfaE bifunctional protein kinase chain/domain
MKTTQLQEIIDTIRSVRIVIAGDFCLDAYWFIDESKSETSVETGLPTHPVTGQEYSPGGAGNIANNIAAMGVGNIRALGVIGNDPFGVEMIRILNKAGIDTENMLVQEKEWSTHVYIKPYSGNRELNRIDFGNSNILHKKTADQLIEKLTAAAAEANLVILNQQVLSGISTDYFRQKVVEVIKSFPGKIFIADSRIYNDSYQGAYRKMNDNEALRLCGRNKKPGETITHTEIKEAANTLFNRYRKPVFITRGSKGSLVIDENGLFEMQGLQILGRIDTVGAGDSYLAGIASALGAGYPADIAAELGAYVAGVTVQKLFQTGTASPQEILEAGKDPDLIYNPDLAEDVSMAQYFNNTDIEIIIKPPERLKIRYAIFDNDGTISTLREGWEKIMAPMMEKVILGEKTRNAGDVLLAAIRTRIEDFINKTTGIQTLAQMKMLIPLIREFGFVSEDEILDEHGYKNIYNDELLNMVKKREEKFHKGELSVDDLTMKNSLSFLKILHDKDIRLYLTSGTDIEDVRHEASLLGYAHFFKDRIYGAVGDVTREAKKIVLDKILDSIGTSEAGMIVTFGDGPVEIRETHKRGGTTVGIASNEPARTGINLTKRTRLIKAGADIVAPDFTYSELLLELLNIS